MGRIQVLPEILANKIAAGEIVERPASVVKELVENALDAGSRQVQVAVSGGGRRSILVSDDGEGMTEDDALLAFEHHATSKLRRAEDLSSIATLGFRGEALPSIASVSRLRLRTRAADAASAAGTEIEIHGGVLRNVRTIAWDRGTEIEVGGLFYNLPARKKFLRSQETELGHVARLVTHYALAHPEVRFGLRSDGRDLLHAVGAADVRERVYQVFGEGFLQRLLEFERESGRMRVHGFASLPSERRTNGYSQYIFVNRRMVRDKVILGAVRQAYRTRLPPNAYPVVLLFLELPYDAVDVNAHPAKTEVRFHDQNGVYRLVFDALAEALAARAPLPSYLHAGPLPPVPGGAVAETPEDSPQPAPAPGPAAGGTQPLVFGPPRGEIVGGAAPGWSGAPELARALDHAGRAREGELGRHLAMKLVPGMLYGSGRAFPAPFRAEGVKILGQLHNSYIVGCDSEGLLIVDQHVAHERILYEGLARSIERGRVERQGLLVPLAIELAPEQKARLGRLLPELGRNGFDVEPFGGDSVLVRSVPASCPEGETRDLFSDILESLEAEERTLDVERIRDRIAVGTACRAAVKVHMPLAPEKMRWLLDELERTRIPTHCPHGRPILLRFGMREIERNFGRA
ncbi:MAG: DNA mismatch repair endonuclease MutL [Acidobacteria bacterium]|nr:DNA mismatch repair endonuclease MutL [Acidobacteriota bacterium]